MTQSESPVLACDMKAFSTTERARYNYLLAQIKGAVKEQHELPEGYAWEVGGEKISLKDGAEWAMMERRCCPFLLIQLQATGSGVDFLISLTGPAGVKDFLVSEFGIGL